MALLRLWQVRNPHVLQEHCMRLVNQAHCSLPIIESVPGAMPRHISRDVPVAFADWPETDELPVGSRRLPATGRRLPRHDAGK